MIKKYWDNVAGAIARVKEAMNEGWCNNPTGLFINSCKSGESVAGVGFRPGKLTNPKGEKPKNTVDTGVSDWFEWARRERIVIAMSGGMVYTVDGEAVEIGVQMRRYPMETSKS